MPLKFLVSAGGLSPHAAKVFRARIGGSVNAVRDGTFIFGRKSIPKRRNARPVAVTRQG